MSQSVMPFFESSEDATKHAILASGKTLKQVACALWPDRSPASANTLLTNCLNENRQERLTADQHIFVANYCGDFSWLHYVAHTCHHSQPEPVTPESEQAQLQRQFIDAVHQIRQIESRLSNNATRMRAA